MIVFTFYKYENLHSGTKSSGWLRCWVKVLLPMHYIKHILLRYLNSQPQNDSDDVTVVKVAPIGKAAFNIRGNTLQSAFIIPANQEFSHCILDRDRLNTITSQLQRMQVIFIDEISMVGSGMFNFFDLRLQQIMGTNKITIWWSQYNNRW